MTSKLVVNTIEADTGISSVSFASSISMDSTSKFHFSAAGIDIDADTNINRPAAGVLGFNINTAEKVRINSTGNVGIATDISGVGGAYGRLSVVIPSQSGGSALQVMNSAVGSGDGSLTNIVLRSVNNLGTQWAGAEYRAQEHIFKNQGTEALRIKIDGKVGIGTDNPSGKLDIQTGTNGNVLIDAEGGSVHHAKVVNDSGDLTLGSRNTSGDTKLTSQRDVIILTGSSEEERIRIESNGQVGINKTPETNGGLIQFRYNEVFTSGTTNLLTSASKAVLRLQTSTNSSKSLFFGGIDESATPYLQVGNMNNGSGGATATYPLVLQPYGGNVGVNNLTPTSALDVSGDLVVRSSLAKIGLIDTDGGDQYQIRNDAGSFIIRNATDSQSALTIDGDGNVTTVKNIRIDTGTAADGIVGRAYGTAYFGLKHADQSSDEYMIISNDNHTYLSCTSGSSIYLRPSANSSAHETIFAHGETTYNTHLKLSGHNLRRSNHHTGHLEGSYNNVGANSAKSNPIYTIGSSYNPGDNDLGNMYGIGYGHGNNAPFISMTNATGWGMYVAADGDCRAFIDASYGRISITSTISQNASDVRLKTNIKVIDNPIEKIKKIRGVTFDWVDNIKTEYDFHPDSMHETGVIAQEIQEVIPDAVTTAPFNGNYTKKSGTDNNFLTVKDEKIIPLCIEAIKELSAQVELLKSKVATLEGS